MNQAERFVKNFGGFGDFEDMVAAAIEDGADHTTITTPTVGDVGDRLEWPDGSAIVIAGDGWDFAYPDCDCWIGAGHAPECPNAKKSI